jgi:hypothetical protein
VDCRRKALGAAAEVAEFCHFRRLEGWSGLRRQPGISDSEGDPEFITVEVSTLDAELPDLTPRVIKVDVEGAELAVLQGGLALLRRARPLLIFEHERTPAELYGASSGALWDLLAELGYEVFAVTGEGPFTRAAFEQAQGIVNWLGTPLLAPPAAPAS